MYYERMLIQRVWGTVRTRESIAIVAESEHHPS